MSDEAVLAKYPFIKQFSKFIVVGVMNTLVDLSILNLLMFVSGQTQGVFYTVFKTLSFITAVIFSYYINKRWTFRDNSEENASKKFSQFIGISIVGAIINVSVATLVVTLARPALGLGFISGQLWGNIGALCGTSIGLIWNFIGYKFIVFKK